MVVKLYGHPVSPPTKLVATSLYEKQIPFEFILVDIYSGQNKTPEFLAKNPFGQIPSIVSFEAELFPYLCINHNPRMTTGLFYMIVVLSPATSLRHIPIKELNLSLPIPRNSRYSTRPCSANSGTLIVLLSLLSSNAYSRSKRSSFAHLNIP